MSYILDALRRADADRERERGAVPGLHARPLGTGLENKAAAARPVALWVALSLSLLALAGVLWWALGRSTPPVPAPAAVALASPAAPILPGIAPAGPPAGPLGGALGGPLGGPLASPPAPVPGPGPARSADAAPRLPKLPLRAPAEPAAEAAAAPRPRAAPPVVRATLLAELPPDLRRELPAMALGGSIYSDSPSGRFMMINGQVVREGEGAAPGVTVERIGPKSAVLRWREMRIEVPL